MKRFFAFVGKEFYHIFRDFRILIIIFLIPILLVLLFGFVIKNDLKDVNIGVYLNSDNDIAIKLVDKITSSNFFKVVDIIQSEKPIEDNFKSGKIKVALIFEKNFSENLIKNNKANIQIITDASEPNNANIMVSYLNGIILNYMSELNHNKILPIQIIPEIRILYNPSMESSFYFIPGIIAVLLIIISTLLTSITITREKELGTMEILLVSPLKPLQIILGKVIPYLVFSFINFILIILLGLFVFLMPIQGNWGLLLFEGSIYILMSLSLGVLISTIANSQQTAMLITMIGLMLPTILLSGFIYPIENMPYILQLLSYIAPSRWFIIILKNIMLKGSGIEYVWKETLILISMMLFFIFLSLKKFKIRLM